MKGKFITLEGGEASGKSTNLHFIAEFLKLRGIPCVTTHEPGGTLLAEEIRSFVLKPHSEKLSSKAELLLMFASRAQHISEVLLPALSRIFDVWLVSHLPRIPHCRRRRRNGDGI